MPDIEERLRAGLTALAGEVPPSEDARTELRRRLDTRRARPRMPALAASAAAVVVLVLFVVSVVAGTRPGEDVAGDHLAPGGASTSSTAPLPVLGTISVDGRTVRAVGYLKGAEYCTALAPPDARTVRPTCEPVPEWPEGPSRTLVMCREVLNSDSADDTGILAQRLIFLTDPRVATLDVRRGDRTGVPITELDRNQHAALFLADFGGRPGGFEYTARDGGGNVVENGVT